MRGTSGLTASGETTGKSGGRRWGSTNFVSRYCCPVITADDDGYDDARAVHNGMFDRRPRAVVRAEQVADVMAAVNFARETGLDLAVRGGGHSAPGFGTNDDGLVIDLSLMRHVHVDPAGRHCAGGRRRHLGRLQLRDPRLRPGDDRRDRVDDRRRRSHAGRRHRLPDPRLRAVHRQPARRPTWSPPMAGQCGPARPRTRTCSGRSVAAAAISASRRRSSSSCIRSTPSTSGLFFYELDHAGDLLRFLREWIKDAPETYGAFPAFQIAPPLPFIPEDRHGDTFAIAVVHLTGPIEEGEAAMAPFRDLAPRVGEMVAPMPYPWLNGAFDAIFPKGIRSYWKGNYVTELTDAAIEAHLTHGPNVPEVSATMHLYPINGAAHRVAATQRLSRTGTPHSRPSYIAAWQDSADDEARIQWVRDYYEATAPHSEPGGYVNFMHDDDQGRVQDNYLGNYARLVDIKRKYDPDNLFHGNQNIKP